MRVLFLTLALIGLDQASKLAVKGLNLPALGLQWEGMHYGASVPLLGDWLKLTFIENPNMAFGLDIGGKEILAIFALAASCMIVWYLWKHRKAPLLMRLALSLVLAGALGNLIDRAFYGLIFGYAPLLQGNVVDFVDFDLFIIRLGDGAFKFWPIFNVADAAVTIGVCILLFQLWPRPAQSPERSAVKKTDEGTQNAQSALETTDKPVV